MRSGIMRLIETQRQRVLAAIGDRLTTDVNADLTAELRELEVLGKLQASFPTPRWAPLFWPLLVGLLAATLVGLACSVPRPATRIILEAEVESLSFRLLENWVWAESTVLDNASVRIREATRIDLPVMNGSIENPRGTALASIEARRLKLASLMIAPGSSIGLKAEAGRGFDLTVGSGGASGQFSIWREVSMKGGPNSEETTASEVVELEVAGPH